MSHKIQLIVNCQYPNQKRVLINQADSNWQMLVQVRVSESEFYLANHHSFHHDQGGEQVENSRGLSTSVALH